MPNFWDKWIKDRKPKTTLTDGSPVPEDGSHRELKPNGQQAGYIVLSAEERAKGFVRPVRVSYIHVGPPAPRFPLRDLTLEELDRYSRYGYVKFEEYPPGVNGLGKFYTQEELDKKGCYQITTMGEELAETYARDPEFYGATFCSMCRQHYKVGAFGEFIWTGTSERVGT